MDDRVVVTGIGLVTSLGPNRESTWRAVRRGECRIRPLRNLPPLPDGLLWVAGVNMPTCVNGVPKTIAMALRAGEEALRDARLWPRDAAPYVTAERCGCAMNAHMGYFSWYYGKDFSPQQVDGRHSLFWHQQWLPNSACVEVSRCFCLYGPRLAVSTACASSLISIILAARVIRDGQADVMLAGGSESIDPLFAAGFRQMGVLAAAGENGPCCRPFDQTRDGFVLGEGAGMLVLERASHAVERGARIYAELAATGMLCEAHHVAGLDPNGETIRRLLQMLFAQAAIQPTDVEYVNAHATGTPANDLAEMRAYGELFGCHCRDLCVSGTKSMLGHLINASGVVESAITLLAIRDGFMPPTMHVRQVDPNCAFNCLPGRGMRRPIRFAVKVASAFGGHVAAVVWHRWDRANSASLALGRAA